MSVVVASGTAVGYGLAYTNNATPVINAIYNWETDKSKALWDSIYSSIFVLGAGIGCSSGGKIIKSGRR